MRILTRLKITSLLTLAAFVILGSVLSGSYLEFSNARNDKALSNAIKTNFFERSSLRDQYFLYRENHLAALWYDNKKASDLLMLEAIKQLKNGGNRDILEEMGRNIEDSTAIFRRIVNNTETLKTAGNKKQLYEELDRRLASQLLVKDSEIRDGATALDEASRQIAEQDYKRLTIFIVLFSTALAASTLLNLTFVGRLFRKRLASLHQGAKIISGGNLNYRIRHKGADELTEVGDAINHMTDELQGFTVKLEAEINERKQAADALRRSTEEIEDLYDNAPCGYHSLDKNGIIQRINDTELKWLGYMREEVVGKMKLSALLTPAGLQTFQEHFTQFKTEGTIHDLELEILRKDGTTLVALVNATAIYDADGNYLLSRSTLFDISERKRVEKALKESEQRYHFLFDDSPLPMWVFDEGSLKFLMVNNRAIEHYGFTREEFSRMTLRDIRPHEDLPDLDQAISSSPDGRQAGEWRHQKKDGSIIRVAIRTVPMRYASHKARIAVIEDITERKTAEQKLIKSEASLRAILDNVPYLIWQKDMEGRFIAVNKAFFNTTGQDSMDEVLGKTDLELWPEELAEKYRADDAEVISARKQKLTEEMSMDKDEVHWVETLKAPILDKNGNLLGTTGFAQDITERKNAELKIRHLAHYDPLTDLPNRTLFSDRLQQALITAKRDKAHMALMFLDLDKFKPINDELGHHVGDLLLKEAARRMQDCVRESDTVARIGGDEFVILLPNIEEVKDAMLVAEKIRHALNQPFALVGKSLYISSSTGIAVYPEHGKDETQLVKNADIAMYHAKESGRNCVTLYHLSMQEGT